MKVVSCKLKIICNCYREKKDNTKRLETGHDATTAENQIASSFQEPRNPCSNCHKMGFKCRAADNEGEKRCQQCIDRGFTSCETSRPLLRPSAPVRSPNGPAILLKQPQGEVFNKSRKRTKAPAATVPDTSRDGAISKDNTIVQYQATS